jgi:hypothetical protein
MSRILALGLSVVINASIFGSLQRVGAPPLPHGEVIVTEIVVEQPSIAQLKLSRWRCGQEA